MNVDLGHLRLQHTSSALTLALCSSARVSADNPEACLLTHGKTDCSTLEAAWISHGANMLLVLDLVFPQQTTNLRFRLQVQEQLTEALKTSPLWSDLCLRPSLSTTCPSYQQDADRLTIKLSRHDSQSIQSSIHQLGAGIPCSHIKPPPGVPCFSLDMVHLEVQVESHGNSDDQGSTISSRPRSSTGMAELHRGHTTSVHASMHHIVSLFDAALRSSISKTSAKLPQDVVISEVSSFKRLDKVFPVVWRAGYAAAIASRAVLVPTISHALSDLATRTIRSKSLRAKMHTLTQSLSQDPDISDQAVNQRAFDVRLWHILQRMSSVSAPSRRKMTPVLSVPSGTTDGLLVPERIPKGGYEPYDRENLQSRPGARDISSSLDTAALMAEDDMLDLEMEYTGYEV